MKTILPLAMLCMALCDTSMAAEQTVSEDTATFTVRPGELRLERARLVSERITRVINLRGNNPLNPAAPLSEPGVAPPAGDGGVNLAGACVGSVMAGMHPVTEAMIASIQLDAATGACTLRPDSVGPTLLLSDPPSEPPLFQGTVDAFPLPDSGWAFVAPSPVGGKLRFPAGTAQTVRLQAPTGAVIDMQFNYVPLGLNRRLDVLSVTPVP